MHHKTSTLFYVLFTSNYDQLLRNFSSTPDPSLAGYHMAIQSKLTFIWRLSHPDNAKNIRRIFRSQMIKLRLDSHKIDKIKITRDVQCTRTYYTVLMKIFAGQKLFPSPVTSALQKYSVE